MAVPRNLLAGKYYEVTVLESRLIIDEMQELNKLAVPVPGSEAYDAALKANLTSQGVLEVRVS